MSWGIPRPDRRVPQRTSQPLAKHTRALTQSPQITYCFLLSLGRFFTIFQGFRGNFREFFGSSGRMRLNGSRPNFPDFLGFFGIFQSLPFGRATEEPCQKRVCSRLPRALGHRLQHKHAWQLGINYPPSALEGNASASPRSGTFGTGAKTGVRDWQGSSLQAGGMRCWELVNRLFA